MWDLVPRPGIEPGPPALGVWSLTHWTTREVPETESLRGELKLNEIINLKGGALVL